MGLTILGLGTAVPATKVPDCEARAVAHRIGRFDDGYGDFVNSLYDGVHIGERYTVLSAQVIRDVLERTNLSRSPFVEALDRDAQGPTTRERLREYVRVAPELAEVAARRALAEAGLDGSSITHLVTVSCTGFQAPGFDIALIKRLPLAATVARTHVGFMGCHGALNGLRVSRAFCRGDPNARVLLVAVETCTLHYSYERSTSRMVSNALFADGAGALVGGGPPVPSSDTWRMTASGSCLLPDSEKAMTWTVGDHGFEMTLMKQVPDLLLQYLRPWLTSWLAEQGLGLEEVASWAVHPGGPRILEVVQAALDLGPSATDVSREILAEHGNMSSPTVLFVLDRLRRRAAPRPCVALGFGPGLAAEVALFL